MTTLLRPALLVVVVLTAVACSTAGTGGSPGTTSASPSAAPSAVPPSSVEPSSAPVGAIEHATGSTDVLLRYENGGGFVAPSFLATQAPIFTLYGDGIVVFRNPALEPPAAQGSVYLQGPFRTAKLDESQIQDVLASALSEGGLGVARPNYENNQVSDASTAIFTVNAGGLKKTVSVYALGMDVEGGADAPARTAFQRLADHLGNFDAGGTIATDVYAPTAYRATLMEGQPAPDQIAWPWDDLTPKDFVFPADPNMFQFASRAITPAQVDALGLKDVQGGFQGLTIASPDGAKVYSLSLRPLLPGETE